MRTSSSLFLSRRQIRRRIAFRLTTTAATSALDLDLSFSFSKSTSSPLPLRLHARALHRHLARPHRPHPLRRRRVRRPQLGLLCFDLEGQFLGRDLERVLEGGLEVCDPRRVHDLHGVRYGLFRGSPVCLCGASVLSPEALEAPGRFSGFCLPALRRRSLLRDLLLRRWSPHATRTPLLLVLFHRPERRLGGGSAGRELARREGGAGGAEEFGRERGEREAELVFFLFFVHFFPHRFPFVLTAKLPSS